ncbi:hypothetical protein LAZ67_20001605 [Cordylochernes scorpioides]|uniref:Uncharacterized protein n=1 Tax=Cordylochernes scorpioides TaxID=51811 RepID=A0ABY6LN12_9ARAC|nr:hypothetical protein LAZ67_20001605 [Cordylochernes scorpioides]
MLAKVGQQRKIERNLRARRPLRCLPLTPVHRQVRLQCDESRFSLCLDDCRKRVWRRPGQREDPGLTVEHHTGPQQGVMVCGAISFDSRTPLVVIPGILTAQRWNLRRNNLVHLQIPVSMCGETRQRGGRPVNGKVQASPHTVYQALEETRGSKPHSSNRAVLSSTRFWERCDELQYASLEHPTHALLDSGPEIWLANPSFEYLHSGDIH